MITEELIIGAVIGFIIGSVISDVLWYSYVKREFGPLLAYRESASRKQKMDEEIMSTLSNFDDSDIEEIKKFMMITELVAMEEDTDGKKQEVETK